MPVLIGGGFMILLDNKKHIVKDNKIQYKLQVFNLKQLFNLDNRSEGIIL